MKLTARHIVQTFSRTEHAFSIETANAKLERTIIEYAKQKCKEQQELAKKYMLDVGQTVFLTSGEDMPYPKF